MVRLPTDINPDVLEKYLAFVSMDLSAACGFTISRPCNGVNATLDAVPEICLRTVVLPPYTVCCLCRFFWSVLLIRTLVFSSTCGNRIRPVPALPIVPREYPKSSWYASSSICQYKQQHSSVKRILKLQSDSLNGQTLLHSHHQSWVDWPVFGTQSLHNVLSFSEHVFHHVSFCWFRSVSEVV